jgi:hypothetical protein
MCGHRLIFIFMFFLIFFSDFLKIYIFEAVIQSIISDQLGSGSPESTVARFYLGYCLSGNASVERHRCLAYLFLLSDFFESTIIEK